MSPAWNLNDLNLQLAFESLWEKTKPSEQIQLNNQNKPRSRSVDQYYFKNISSKLSYLKNNIFLNKKISNDVFLLVVAWHEGQSSGRVSA